MNNLIKFAGSPFLTRPNLLLAAIILCMFKILLRIIISPQVSRLPILILLGLSLFICLQERKLIWGLIKRNKLFFLSIVAGILAILVAPLINTSSQLTEVVKTSLVSFFTYLSISLATASILKKEQLIAFIDTIAFVTIFVGGSLWIFESIGEPLGHYYRLFYKKLIFGTLDMQTVSRYGFLGDAVGTITMLIAFGVWSAARIFETENKTYSNLFKFSFIISSTAIIVGESILPFLVYLSLIVPIFMLRLENYNLKLFTINFAFIFTSLFWPDKRDIEIVPIIGTLFVTNLIFFKSNKKLRSFKSHIILISTAILCYLSYTSQVPVRINKYLTKDSHLLKLFIPKLSGCDLSMLTQNSFGENCDFGEFHIFRLWSDGNFFVLLSCFSLIAFTILKLRHFKEMRKENYLSTILLPLSVILASAHYRPIATWGPNIVFALGLASLLKWSRDESVQ